MSTKLQLSRELADLTLVLTEIIRHEAKSGVGASGPTFAQFKMLRAIGRGVHRVGKLAEAFGISQPATSIMVDTMVNDGLVKRVPHAGDRRQIELHLTARASASIDAIFQRAFVTIDERLSALSATKQKQLAAQIREVTQLLLERES
jgi:DNA-binding MarR family transcriptional regulator